MKPRLFFFLFLAALTPADTRAAEPEPLTAAVLDFQTSGEKLAGKGSELASLLNARLSTAPSLILVEREDIKTIFGEQELGLSGNVTPETAAKVGNLTGAKVLVTGRFFEVGRKFYLVAKIMSTETSRVYGETVTFDGLATLDAAVLELAPKIQAVVEKKGDTLVAKVETPEERLGRLKKLIAGKRLPSVSVAVTEQHISRPVIDPAVQTELQMMLQRLGFEVIDPKTPTRRPEVAITGEAFSELAGRRGNLVSCRARIEIKAAQSATGKLLLVDRQSDAAVDLAENVAGKRALENGALKLLERMLPKIVSD